MEEERNDLRYPLGDFGFWTKRYRAFLWTGSRAYQLVCCAGGC
jgi:hypothetical protein